MTSRTMARAQSTCRHNLKFEPPLIDASDILAAISLCLFLMAVAVWAGYIAGGTP